MRLRLRVRPTRFRDARHRIAGARRLLGQRDIAERQNVDQTLVAIQHGQAAYIVLAHLSESNNLPALARVSAERALRDRMSLLANKLLLASQQEPLAAIAL